MSDPAVAIHAAAGSTAEVGQQTVVFVAEDIGVVVYAFVHSVLVVYRSRTTYVANIASNGGG